MPGDVVLVHTIDRWAPSERVQAEALESLGGSGVGFASIAENIDFTGPAGTLMLTLMAAFAEFYAGLADATESTATGEPQN